MLEDLQFEDLQFEDLQIEDLQFIEFSPEKIKMDFAALAFALELKTLPCIFAPIFLFALCSSRRGLQLWFFEKPATP